MQSFHTLSLQSRNHNRLRHEAWSGGSRGRWIGVVGEAELPVYCGQWTWRILDDEGEHNSAEHCEAKFVRRAVKALEEELAWYSTAVVRPALFET